MGSWRDDFRIAKLESLIVNICQQLFADPKKPKPLPVSPIDYMIDWSGDGKEKRVIPKAQSTEEMKNVLMKFAKSQNANVKRKGLIDAKRGPVKKPIKKP